MHLVNSSLAMVIVSSVVVSVCACFASLSHYVYVNDFVSDIVRRSKINRVLILSVRFFLFRFRRFFECYKLLYKLLLD